MDNENLACKANRLSISNVMAGNKEGWLALFAEDAVIHDPVGPSMHDPEGKGFQGKARISEFWDTMIATGDLTIVPHRRFAAGEHHAAVNMSSVNIIANTKTFVEMVACYEVNKEGKVKSIKVYWDADAPMKQFEMGGAAAYVTEY
jgi:ketosteroid isomerase-like protein